MLKLIIILDTIMLSTLQQRGVIIMWVYAVFCLITGHLELLFTSPDYNKSMYMLSKINDVPCVNIQRPSMSNQADNIILYTYPL